MAVYMLFIREGAVRDQAELDIYSRMNREGPRDPKLKPLVVYGAIEAVEGTAPDGMVVVEFPTVEDAKAWYNSPSYQAALVHRQKGADYRAIIVQGLPGK
jgi:uncharacterized protein (DUF1330 family)